MNLFGKYRKKNIWKEKDILNFYNDLKSQHIFGIWNIDEKQLLSALLECQEKNRFQNLIRVLYASFNSVYKKEEPKIIGDKNPVYSYNFGRIFPVFPNAKYIHLTRDYRDQILSMKKMDFEMSNPALVAYRWKLSVREVSTFNAKYPDRFYSLKYEDLVTNPEMKMREICGFLGIDYVEEMLDFHRVSKVNDFLPEEAMNKFHSSLLNPISPRKVNQWKNGLSKNDIKIADSVVGKYADKAGYERLKKSTCGIYFIPSLPFLLYGILWNMSRKIVPLLPFFVKKGVWRISPELPRFIKRNFTKNRKN